MSDHFIFENGQKFAGRHILIDLHGARHLDDQSWIDGTLRTCITICGATLLNMYLHPFEENGGISGVAVLAESHISIHTWPEANYAALDIFMCGDADPEKAIPILLRSFQPTHYSVRLVKRGLL